jgi:hypothetical protein
MKKILILLIGALLTSSAYGTVVDFTGGIATGSNGNTFITSQSQTFYNIVSYVEDNYELKYITNGSYSMQTVGNYYYTGNDVIHGHWLDGLQSIDVRNINNSAFDLNYFTITSNTERGGGPASGNEHISVQGYRNGLAVTNSYLLPSEDWGMNTTSDVLLSNEFDQIDLFRISGYGAFCFGMDAFYINEAAPVNVGVVIGDVTPQTPIDASIPETSSLVLGALGMLLLFRRKR